MSRSAARRTGIHAAVAVVLTWPLALHLTSSLPLGIEDTATVPLFNLWTLRWNQLQVADLFRSYWDAPIFHPTPGAFAFSDPQPLTGLVFAPLSWLTHSPTLGYNLVVLAAITLNGVAAARLARRVGAGPWPALLAGVLAQGLPFAMNQIGVLQLVMLFPLFYLADAVVAWATTDERWAGPAIGIWLAATFLTSSYYGLFAMVVVPLAALTLLTRRCWDRRRLTGLAIGAVVVAITALPVALAQKRYTDPFPRTAETIDQLSAQPIDWVHLQPGKVGVSVVPFLRGDGGSFHALFPGTVLLVAAVVGVVLATRRSAVDYGRRAVLFLGVAVLLAFALSFGLHLGIGSWNVYELLRDHVPGYASLRSPFRFAALVQVFLVPLAAIAIDRLWRHPEDGGRVLGVGLVLFGLLEVALPPLAIVDVPPPQRDWPTFLAAQPGTDAAAVVPFPPSGSVEDYEPTTQWMLAAIEQPHPLANGYSGLFPPEYDALEATMREFPSPDSLASLDEHRVRWVVVQHSWLNDRTQREIDAVRRLHVASVGEQTTVYELSP